jgi:glycosyltransferase 2 family protein
MRRIAFVGLAAGFILVVALLLHFGVPEVGAALRAAGVGGLAAISFLHLIAMAVSGVAWWVVAGGRQAGASLRIFVWGRVMRDAGSEVLPLSQIGGYVVGARSIILRRVAAPLAAATTVVDVTLELCGQVVYTLLGLVLLIRLRPQSPLALPILIGSVLAVAAVSGFVLAQHRGAAQLDRLAARLAREWLTAISAAAVAVLAEIRRIYSNRRGILFCFLLHLAAWIGTGIEAWVALRMMGVKLDFAPVLVIESLLYAVRSVAFIVPNAIGIQEGAYILLGAGFGLTPDVALALSLLKRGRDLLLGVPPLLVWQLAETRRFWFSRPFARRLKRESRY